MRIVMGLPKLKRAFRDEIWAHNHVPYHNTVYFFFFPRDQARIGRSVPQTRAQSSAPVHVRRPPRTVWGAPTGLVAVSPGSTCAQLPPCRACIQAPMIARSDPLRSPPMGFMACRLALRGAPAPVQGVSSSPHRLCTYRASREPLSCDWD